MGVKFERNDSFSHVGSFTKVEERMQGKVLYDALFSAKTLGINVALAVLLSFCEFRERPPGIDQGFREVPISSVSTTLDLPVAALSAGLNASLPRKLAEETIKLNRKGERLHLSIEKNRDLKLAYRSGQVYVAVPVKVTAVVEKKVLGMMVSNKEQPLKFSGTVNFSGPFELDENWQPVFDFKWRSLDWERAPIFDILGFRLDLTGTIDKKVKEFGPELNEKINQSISNSVDLRSDIQKAWKKVQDPIKLSVEGDNFYYRMNMSTVKASLSKKKEDTLSLDLQAGFSAEVSQTLSDKTYLNLPARVEIQKKSKPLDLYIDTRLRFEFLNKKARDYTGQSFEIEDREVIIRSAEIYPRAGYVHCEVMFTGDSDGKILLYGIPAVDEDKVFTVDKFGYELTTDDELLQLTDAALHSGFERMIRKVLTVPLLDQLPRIESESMKGIENSNIGDKLDLNLRINDLDLHSLGITEQELQIIWRFEGASQIRLEKGILSKSR
ncbi:MAG: DUF4403 family protein [Cyclobacteriaceae bacterium]